jgi:hypothetical protein
MVYNYVSIKFVISKVYRDLQLDADESWINMIEWGAEAMDFIGVGVQYSTIIKTLKVNNYKVCLPCGFKELIGISHRGQEMYKLQGLYDTNSCKDNVDDDDHHALRTQGQIGYTINEGFINTNFACDEITISYKGLNLDEEGFPMIPDMVEFKEALYRYILTKLYYPQMLSGKIPANLYKDMQQEWFAYGKQAAAKCMMPNISTMDNIVQEWMQLVPQIARQGNSFRGLGQPQDSIYNNL